MLFRGVGGIRAADGVISIKLKTNPSIDRRASALGPLWRRFKARCMAELTEEHYIQRGREGSTQSIGRCMVGCVENVDPVN